MRTKFQELKPNDFFHFLGSATMFIKVDDWRIKDVMSNEDFDRADFSDYPVIFLADRGNA